MAISLRRNILYRVAIAFGVWFVVAHLALYVAWHQALGSHVWPGEQNLTQEYLRELTNAFAEYQTEFKVPARSIDDLQRMTNGWESVANIKDGWERPFIFSFDGTNLVATSYGRDGKPGGQGLDCDLTSLNRSPKEARAGFEDFMHSKQTEGMVYTCLVCGVIAGLLAASIVKVPDYTRQGLSSLAVKVIATAIGAFVIAIFISVLHVPSGH